MPKPAWIAATLLAAALAGGSQAQAQVPLESPAPGAAAGSWYTQAELDQLLAHVALYPDELLSHVLIAATYPLEVVEAARWTRRNPGLSGDAAVAAAMDQDWAPAVTALVAFPEILQRMDEDLAWTQRLGDAVLAQEDQVMATVQALRQRAWAAGSLARLEHVNVRQEREVIYIEPVRREIIHVPYYNPVHVYGPWWHPAHPPWFWTPVYWAPGYRAPASFYSGITFWWGSGISVSSGFLFSRPDWYRRHLVVVRVPVKPPRHRGPPRVVYRGYRDWSGSPQRWRHDPQHRRGVAYSSPLPPRHVAPGKPPRVVAPVRAGAGRAAGSGAEAGGPRESRPGIRQPGPREGWQPGRAAPPGAAGPGRAAAGTRPEQQRLRIEQRLRADGWQRQDARPEPGAGRAASGRGPGEVPQRGAAGRAPAPPGASGAPSGRGRGAQATVPGVERPARPMAPSRSFSAPAAPGDARAPGARAGRPGGQPAPSRSFRPPAAGGDARATAPRAGRPGGLSARPPDTFRRPVGSPGRQAAPPRPEAGRPAARPSRPEASTPAARPSRPAAGGAGRAGDRPGRGERMPGGDRRGGDGRGAGRPTGR